MGELSILSPRPEVVVVDGDKVKVHPVRLRDFERFGRASAGLFQMLGSVSVEDIGAYAERHADELAEVLVATTDLSAKAVSRLSVATSVQLMVQVVRVNAGFFGQAQAAMAKALAGLPSPSA